MKYTKLFLIVCIIVLGWFAFANFRGVRPAFGPPAGDIAQKLEKSAINTTDFPLILPPGFTISVFAKDLGSPRLLAFDPVGTLLASISSRGHVVALPDDNRDGVADRTEVILDHLNRPHGIAFHPKDKTLYVAETDGISVYDYDPTTRKATNRTKIIDLPGGGNHFTRTIGFGPDGRLYISVGSSCNVCVEGDERRAAVLVADVNGKEPITPKVFASGLRNSVFFTWRPGTKELWATDMGRDLIGDDLPPDEVNIVKEGSFYGWPYCYGKNVQDTIFTPTRSCDGAIPSHIELPAHSAPLGLAFIPSSPLAPLATSDPSAPSRTLETSAWPMKYQEDLLVAYHGSWNRSEPTGYKIVRMKLDAQGNDEGTEDFISGWLTKDDALGRPVDLVFGPDGSLYISDDKSGVIYRVSQQQ